MGEQGVFEYVMSAILLVLNLNRSPALFPLCPQFTTGNKSAGGSDDFELVEKPKEQATEVKKVCVEHLLL